MVNSINNHHPDLLTSWRRLTDTEIAGIIVANIKIVDKGANTSSYSKNDSPAINGSINDNITVMMVINNVNNQNSDLDALSEKFVYFTKHIFTASKKFIVVLHSYFTFITLTSKNHKDQTKGKNWFYIIKLYLDFQKGQMNEVVLQITPQLEYSMVCT
mgnify:CR=1 FL=1